MQKTTKNIYNFHFKCCRSVAPIENKRFDVKYEAVETSVTDYCDHVRQGYAHLAYCEGGRREANYVFDHVICVDIDKVDYDLQACYERAVDKPNFIHATPSDGKDGKHSFHLLYFFEDPLTKAEKRAHAQVLREAFGTDADAHLDQPVQVVGGMSLAQGEDLSTKQMFGCDYLYSKDTSLVAEQAEPVVRTPLQDKRKKEFKIWLENEHYDGYFNEYHCHKLLPNEGKLCPRMRWTKDEKGKSKAVIKVLKDGEGRRRFLYAIGVGVRVLSNDTTCKEGLENNLRYWANNFCVWGNGLDAKWISRTAERIMSLDFSTLTLPEIVTRKKHILDMKAIHNEGDKVSWQKCLAQSCYAEKDPDILQALKPFLHLTLDEMCAGLNDKGIAMGKTALKALLKRNGKPHRVAKKRYQRECEEALKQWRMRNKTTKKVAPH